MFADEGAYWHLFGVGASLGAWLWARRGKLPIRWLFVLDAAGTVLVLGGYSVMGLKGAPQSPERAALLMMLITMCTVTLRAIIVPSTPGHTLAVTGFGSLPVLVITYYSAAAYPLKADLPPLAGTAFMSIWVVICLIMTGVTSKVIYGLRVQVAQAQRLGQYVLDELIGEGGMGVVYKARHALLRRPTAIKLSPNSVDGRSDLYALGAVGYFLLTGKPVFSGGSVIEVCLQHVNAEPVTPSVRLGKPVPQLLEELVLRCLAKSPGDRPQTAEEFLMNLASCNVNPWPREEAAAWWTQHSSELSRRDGQRGARSVGGRDTVVIDFADFSHRERRKHA